MSFILFFTDQTHQNKKNYKLQKSPKKPAYYHIFRRKQKEKIYDF